MENKYWTLAYRYNDKVYEEYFEFLSPALMRLAILELEGMKVSIHKK